MCPVDTGCIWRGIYTAGDSAILRGAFAPLSKAETMEVELTIIDHYSMETRVVVRNLPVVLGRDEQADVLLKDPWASHRHCSLSECGGVLVIRDLGSKNGIFLKGHRVSEPDLLPGDRFAVGRTEISVHYRQAGEPAAVGAESCVAGETAAPAGAAPPRKPETLDLLYGIVIDGSKPQARPDDTAPDPSTPHGRARDSSGSA